MFDPILDFAVQAAASLVKTLSGLAWPAVFFLCIGFAVKRGRLWTDMRRAAGEGALNLKLLAFNVVCIVPVITVLAQGMHTVVKGGGYYLVPPSFWLDLPPLVTIAAAVFIGDFIGYWRHRFEHCRLLWPSHAVHHSDTEMTWLTLERFHPVNRLTTFVIDAGILLLLGLPPFATIANSMVRHFYGFFIHADLPWTYGPLLGRVFISPAAHRWHHANDPVAFGSNFATVFSVFDRAFGTWYMPGPCDAPLGVNGLKGGFWAQLANPFRPSAYRGLGHRPDGGDALNALNALDALDALDAPQIPAAALARPPEPS